MSARAGRESERELGLPPLVSFDEALSIGRALHDYWSVFAHYGVRPPFMRDDLEWGDLVQFVLRRATRMAHERAKKFSPEGEG